MERNKRENSFNFMRLVFSILVVLSHSFGLILLTEPTILNRPFGNFAVHCFFALSGYLIASSYKNSKGIIDFAYKRVLRLLPAFIVAFLLGLLITHIFMGFTANPVPYIINGPVWTLSYEILCYFICAIFGFLGLLNPIALGTFWACSGLLIIMNTKDTSLTFQVIVPMLFLFLSGAFIAVNEDKFRIKTTGWISVLLLLLIEIKPFRMIKAVHLLPWLYGPGFDAASIDFLAYIALLPIAIVYIGKYLPFRIALKNDISYGMYIYAWPIQQIVIYEFLKMNLALSPWVLFFISLSVTAVFAFISWKVIEKPAISLKKYSPQTFLSDQLKKLHPKFMKVGSKSE